MAVWGQEWIEEEPSLENIDVRFLVWDIRRNVRPVESLPPRFTVRFDFEGAPDGLKEHWLVFEQGEVDLCYVDPGHEVDVHLETDLKTMTRVWMGWQGLSEAMEDESLLVTGAKAHTASIRDWLGLSGLAGVPKKAVGQRVRLQGS